MCMTVFLACMRMCHNHAWCSWKSGKGVGSPGTEGKDSCEPPRGCWEWDRGPLRVLSTFNC